MQHTYWRLGQSDGGTLQDLKILHDISSSLSRSVTVLAYVRLHKSQDIKKRCHWYFTFTKQTQYKLHSPTLSSKPWLQILSFDALLKFGTNVLGMDVLVCGTCLWLYWYVAPVYAHEENRALDSFLYYFLPWHRSHTGQAQFWSWLSSRGCLVVARSARLLPPITGIYLCHTFYVGLRIRTQVPMPSCLQSKSSYHGALSIVLLGRFPYRLFCNYLYPYMLFTFIFCYSRDVLQVKWG